MLVMYTPIASEKVGVKKRNFLCRAVQPRGGEEAFADCVNKGAGPEE
jgi:hypothetical protein